MFQDVSSNGYEVIKTILDLFYFVYIFLQEDSTRTKSTENPQKRKKHKKNQAQTSDFYSFKVVRAKNCYLYCFLFAYFILLAGFCF